MNLKTGIQQKKLPLTILLDGLDDEEIPLHPEMITPEEEDYKRGLERVVDLNTH